MLQLIQSIMKQITISILVMSFAICVQSQNCYNPNRRSGSCISIFACQQLLSLVTEQPITEDDRRFLVESQCESGSGEPPHVCCNSDVGFLSGPISESIVSFGNGEGDIIPSPPTCGSQRNNLEIFQNDVTPGGTLPWLAHLAYVTDDGQTSINCGGSLINSRYILTAAHCVKGEVETTIGPLFAVRLGVSDLSDVYANCSETNGCIDVGIEEVIPHELYNVNSANRYHDIALIRLSREIPYSDSTRPICLPATLSFTRSVPKTELRIAGWAVSIKGDRNSSKLDSTIPIVGREDCSDMLQESENITIADWQICAGGRDIDDSCAGDSGGPLMTFIHNYWVIDGIFSYNDYCGSSNLRPGVYTRVSGYGNWIRRHMRA